MTHKYGLLEYSSVAANADKFDVVTLNDYQTYVNELIGTGTDKGGQTSYFFNPANTLIYVIVEDSNWGAEHDTIINDALDAWKSVNQGVDIGEFQVIFDYDDRMNIQKQADDRRLEIITS